MARTQGFERDAVVRAARTVFWRRGFEDTAVPDLEEATGLSRSSIYNAFGSKRGLFDAAVQSYLDEVVRPRLRPFSEEPVSPRALADYVTGLRQGFAALDSMPARNGCLLINTANAPLARDPEMARVIAEYRSELRSALLRGAAARHPDWDHAENERCAEIITGLVVASFALARVDSDAVADLLAAAAAAVDAPTVEDSHA